MGHSQTDRTSYDLLWELKKDGTPPSYLFGTMHVKDERAFQFSDSVLLSLESCEQFAIELHPDSIFNSLIDEEFFNTVSSPDKLLTEEEMKLLKVKFKKNTGMEYDNFNFRNPLALLEFLSAENNDRPQRQTFLDAYLVGIAKTLQKSINGLERMETQISSYSKRDTEDQREELIDLLRSESQNSENYLDNFIASYSKGNLEDLEEYVSFSLTSEAFIERNKTMAESINTLQKNGSIFSAVGAAHLIGENSVLRLLEEKGFRVRRVKAYFTGVADEFSIDHSKMKWEKYSDFKRGFSIETPGPLVKVPGDKFEFINMYSMLDITGASSFIIFSIDIRSFPDNLKEKDFKKMILDQFKKDDSFKTSKSHKFFKNGIEFNELYLEKDDGSSTRIQYCLQNNNLFANACFGFFGTPFPPEQERFFKSFTVFPPRISARKKSAWENTTGAFRINFPEDPEYKITELENPINLNGDKFLIHLFNAPIPNNNSIGYVAYNDFPTGYYKDPFYDALDETLNEINQQGTILSEVDTTFVDGQLAFEFDFLAQDKFPSRMKFLFRGNRSYRIFEMSMNEDFNYSQFKPFLNSFEFLPYSHSDKVNFISEDASFEISFFDSKVSFSDTLLSTTNRFSEIEYWSNTNPNSGGFYRLEKNQLSSFYKSEHADSLLYAYANDLLQWSDSIVSKDFFLIDSLSALHLKYQNTYSKDIDASISWFDGQHVYCLYRLAAQEEMQNSDLLEIALSFKQKEEVPKMDINKSKALEIIEDLKNVSAIVREQALGAFSFYDWDESEREILEKAFLDDTYDKESQEDIKQKLVLALSTLNEEKTKAFLNNVYSKQSENIKEFIISILSKNGKSSIDEELLRMFLKETPKKEEAVHTAFFYAIRDSLEIPKNNLNAFINILDKGFYEKEILHVITQVLIAFPETAETIKENMHILTRNSIKDFNSYVEKIENQEIPSYRLIQNYLDLSKAVIHPSFVEPYTRLLGTLEANWIKNEAIEARIINGLPVKNSKIRPNLKNKYTRYNLMRAFEKGNRFKELPAKYKSNEGMAKAALYEHASWEDEGPDETKFLGLYSVGDSTYFCFEVDYFYSKHSYLGIAGPFVEGEELTPLKNIKAILHREAIEDNWKKQCEILVPLIEGADPFEY